MKNLKDVYNFDFVESLTKAIKTEYPNYDRAVCHQLIFQRDWQNLALKKRMRRITEALYETLPKDYTEALRILTLVDPSLKEGLSGLIFPDYVEQYGMNHWNQSMQALKEFTQYSTSEFAVRPFLLANQEKMIAQLVTWSTDTNEHVRRLASEGARPRLPWGMTVPKLKENPYIVLPILENLKKDQSLYVRKSVANNLNDISKTHPDLVREIASKWYGDHEHTNWIVKHACRTLLKKGDKQVLAIFGYENDEAVKLDHFTCSNQVAIGEAIQFSFRIQATEDTKVRIEYAIDYVKARGNRNQKVFKITEMKLLYDQTKEYSKTHSFKNLSTRKHYQGKHTITIIINGTPKASLDFEVV
ncbi:DNA alkylation repair protein [Halalkalibacter flavus]|jgi:3-methyladenine DNA glycosylase AlkC|uniref:DNA alkylation repair protein n=1 Tax=Halalkalibacter flavus TaxID=3090668 RepID=UPI002FC643A0